MEQKFDEISAIFVSNDADQVSKSAHAIKSMSANIGAQRVRAISSLIESAGRNGDLNGAESNMAGLRHAYDEYIDEFKSEYLAE